MYFYGSKPGPHEEKLFWTLGPLFELTWFKTTRQSYSPNFKQLSLEVLEKKIFKLFFYYLPQSPASSPILDPGAAISANLVAVHQFMLIPHFKHVNLVVLKKDF